MATLATQVVDTDGLVATYSNAAPGGDKCATGDGVFLHVKNGHTASQTVTLVTPQTVDGDLAVANRDVVVVNATEAFIAVPDLYRDPADGLASITYVGTTALDIACVRAS